jgi:cell division protein FtsN
MGPPEAGRWYRVHIASFRSVETVASIAREMRGRGLAAWYEPAADAPGWYRVFVGRFSTEAEAASFATWLLEKKWVDRADAFPSSVR